MSPGGAGIRVFHGLGLATKCANLGCRERAAGEPRLVNVGVEAGQVLVLAVVVTLFNLWRGTRSFASGAFYANLALMAAGFTLMAYQLTGYFAS